MEQRDVLLVFAKMPGKGIAKSRIAARVGAVHADRIYRELLAHTAQLAQNFHTRVAWTGPDGPGELTTIFTQACGFLPQAAGGLGERLQAACEHLFAQGYSRVCAIGCDSPALHPGLVTKAFAALANGSDVVAGPSRDGGYYLIGCTPGHTAHFAAKGFSTPGLLRETKIILERCGHTLYLLPTLFDIDTWDDYAQWKHTPTE